MLCLYVLQTPIVSRQRAKFTITCSIYKSNFRLCPSEYWSRNVCSKFYQLDIPEYNKCSLLYQYTEALS